MSCFSIRLRSRARQLAASWGLALLFAGAVAGQIDRQATWETKVLYYNLDLLSRNRLLFGHQSTTAQGRGWRDPDGSLDTSDVKAGLGTFPAVYGFDFNAGWDAYRAHVERAFERGGIITYSWHAPNPVTGGNFYDTGGNPIREIVPGGTANDLYKSWLREIAEYARGLRVNGKLVPILFRPFHENTGSWFWWGANFCTPEEFVRAWRYTVHFLRDTLSVHNFLYVYSPDGRSAVLNYAERYPGDDYVDVIGFDMYENDEYSDVLVQACRVVVQFAEERGKIAAITETGVSGGLQGTRLQNWFTEAFLEPLKADPIARRVSWALFWTNSESTYWIPLPGDPTFPAFRAFYQDSFTVFQDNLPNMYEPLVEDTAPPTFTEYPEPGFVAFRPQVVLEVSTNERAYLRYSDRDMAYERMTLEFPEGQGGLRHRLVFGGEHGCTYRIFVRAADPFGNVTAEPLVLDFSIDTTKVAVSWRDPEYDDAEWPSGRAPLGYGGTETLATFVDSARTVYFRAHFVLPDSVPGLGVLVRGHDGAVVYVNGVEVGRVQMPQGGEVRHSTRAVSDRPFTKVLVLGPDALSSLRLGGENVVAVELHAAPDPQVDLSFDARIFDNRSIYLDLGSEWRYYDRDQEPPFQVRGRASGTGRRETMPVLPGIIREFGLRANPTAGRLAARLELARGAEVQADLFDVRGRRVWAGPHQRLAAGTHTLQVAGERLPAGVYLLRVTAGCETKVVKVTVVR